MAICPFIEPGEFAPEVVATMSGAFEAACKELDYAATAMVLQILAERIIHSARAGERDPFRLLAAALVGVPREEG
jgi:hypothetical protein